MRGIAFCSGLAFGFVVIFVTKSVLFHKCLLTLFVCFACWWFLQGLKGLLIGVVVQSALKSSVNPFCGLFKPSGSFSVAQGGNFVMPLAV